MGCAAYVAKRYEVEWVCTDIRFDDVENFVRELENSELYEVVWYKSDSDMQYEFGRSGLEEVIKNENISVKSKEVAKQLLEIGDKNKSFVRVEFSM
jgi:hypothetical protein